MKAHEVEDSRNFVKFFDVILRVNCHLVSLQEHPFI